MSARTRASSPSGAPLLYQPFLWGLGWDLVDGSLDGASQDSTANRYVASPIIVPFRCRVDKIGVWAGGQVNSGQFMLGLHDSDVNLLPNALVCQTAAANVVGLSSNLLQFRVPTTTPTIQPGLYYVGYICDTTYALGVAGMRVMTVFIAQVVDAGLLTFDGFGAAYIQNMGGFLMPDPFVEVLSDTHIVSCLALKVTAV